MPLLLFYSFSSHFPFSSKPTSSYFPLLSLFFSHTSPLPSVSLSVLFIPLFLPLLFFPFQPITPAFLFFIPNYHPALITFSNHKILLLDEFRFFGNIQISFKIPICCLNFNFVKSFLELDEDFVVFLIFERNTFVLAIFYLVSAA